MKTQLLCTFTTKKDIEETISSITTNYTIVFDRIYVLQNENNISELICTYNVDTQKGIDY